MSILKSKVINTNMSFPELPASTPKAKRVKKRMKKKLPLSTIVAPATKEDTLTKAYEQLYKVKAIIEKESGSPLYIGDNPTILSQSSSNPAPNPSSILIEKIVWGLLNRYDIDEIEEYFDHDTLEWFVINKKRFKNE